LNPFTDEDPSEIDLEFYHIYEYNYIEIKALPPGIGNYTFFLLAKSQAEQYIYKTINLRIMHYCDNTNQALTPVGGTHVIEVLKNEGVVTLMTYAEMEALFTYDDTEYCPIWRFERFMPPLLESEFELPTRFMPPLLRRRLDTLDDLLDYDNFEEDTIPDYSSLTFNTTVADNDNEDIYISYYFTLYAEAEGGASATQDIEI
jgi:hypothetical protein